MQPDRKRIFYTTVFHGYFLRLPYLAWEMSRVQPSLAAQFLTIFSMFYVKADLPEQHSKQLCCFLTPVFSIAKNLRKWLADNC